MPDLAAQRHADQRYLTCTFCLGHSTTQRGFSTLPGLRNSSRIRLAHRGGLSMATSWIQATASSEFRGGHGWPFEMAQGFHETTEHSLFSLVRASLAALPATLVYTSNEPIVLAFQGKIRSDTSNTPVHIPATSLLPRFSSVWRRHAHGAGKS
jgi:hypothetical protein